LGDATPARRRAGQPPLQILIDQRKTDDAQVRFARKRDGALALFVGPTLLDASLDIEDLSATRLHNAELTLSESFKFPRADSVESISINGSLVIIWFFSPPAW